MLCHMKHGKEEATAFEPSTEDAHTQSTVMHFSRCTIGRTHTLCCIAVECLDHESRWGTGNQNILNRHDSGG